MIGLMSETADARFYRRVGAYAHAPGASEIVDAAIRSEFANREESISTSSVPNTGCGGWN